MASATAREPEPPQVTGAADALGALLQTGLLPLCVIRDGRLAYGNPAFTRTFSLPESTGTLPFTDLVTREDRAAVSEQLAAIASGDIPAARFGFHGLLPDGTVRHVEFFGARAPAGGSQTIVSLILDVTESRRGQAQLSSLAFTDTLTGLSNRAQFFDRLRDALVKAQTAGTPFAVLIGDIDGFKGVNDRHGHEAGDLVLHTVAGRLRAASRSNDTVARLGGDEFAMVLPSIGTPEHAALVAGRVVRTVAAPVEVAGEAVSVGISVGIALNATHGDSMDRLVHAADSAMYAAKRQGKSCFAIATDEDGNGSVPSLRFVQWNESALVGVSEIDEQHRHMVDLINALGEDLKSIQPRARVQATLDELVRFTRQHFETEERLLDAYAADQLERHRRSHRQLLEDLQSLASGVDEQSMALTMRYLQDWLFAHIDAADRPLAEALNARGIR